MKISFGGFGESVATFYNNAAVPAAAGDFVKISGSGEVSPCDPGDAFIGICIGADSEFASVQTSGYITAAYTGAVPEFGYIALKVGSSPKELEQDVDGTSVTVYEADTPAGTVGFML